MTDITAGALPRQTSELAPPSVKKSFFRRLYDSMVEARTRQAEAIIREYRQHGSPLW